MHYTMIIVLGVLGEFGSHVLGSGRKVVVLSGTGIPTVCIFPQVAA